nr:hypothetical protein [Tanacetum cinerariifolium]
MRHGFDLGYKIWVHHGELDLPSPPPVIDNTRQPQMSDMTTLLNDLSYIPLNNEHNEPTQGDIGETSNEPTQNTRNEFKELYASVNEELKGYKLPPSYYALKKTFKMTRWKDSNTPGKKVPKKVLRYFSIIPRLQCLCKSSHTAKEMIWHATRKCTGPGKMQHPVDGRAWKKFDTKYLDFAKEPRNVRLGLAADGFNPFGNLSQAYSMWQVILITYNLPLWLCMKESSFMLTLLIPSPKSPGKDIDVYLRPLIKDLKRSSLEFNGKTDNRDPPKEFGREEILAQLDRLPTCVKGKHPSYGGVKIKRDVHVELNWTKRSNFYELEYWSFLLLRHNLDIMNIEKNVLEAILNTLLMNDKSNDTTKERQDLETALEGRPIRPRWMFPFERYMKKLKGYVRNKAKPEGSIAKGYVAEKALTFSYHYFWDVTTKFNRPDHNVDPHPSTCQFQVFRSVCKSFGLWSVIRFDAQEVKKLKWYVLHNIPEIDTYRSQFKSLFPNKDMKEEFFDWFGSQIHQRHVDTNKDPEVSTTNELFTLACGPTRPPISINFYVVDGVSLNDLDNATLHIDGQLTEVDASPDIIDVVDEDDDIIDDEDVLPHDLEDSDDEDLINVMMMICACLYYFVHEFLYVMLIVLVQMSTDVARSYGGDGDGEDRPLPHHVPSGCEGCFANRGKGKRKPNLGGRAAGRLNTRDKTQNLSLKEITDTKGPVPIWFELRAKQTLMPLGEHAAHWSSYIGEVIMGVPLYHPSCLKVPKERKAALIADIGTQFDLRPHTKSPDWTEIHAGIQQHLQKAYNTNKAAFKAHHWVIDPTTGTYNVDKIRWARPQDITADEWDKYIPFWNDPKNIARAAQNRQNQAKSTRQSLTTQEYPSLIDTFLVAYNVNGEFFRMRIDEEIKRLRATGTYTNDEINHLARGGKQRGHILGVGRVLPARATASPSTPAHESMLNSLHKKVDFMMSLFKNDSKYSDMFSQFESGGAETIPKDMSPGNICHRGTNYLTEKFVGPTVSLRIVAVEDVSGSLFPLVENARLGGLGAWIGVVSEVVWGTIVVFGCSRCSIVISNGGAGSASGMFGKTASKTKSGLFDVLVESKWN